MKTIRILLPLVFLTAARVIGQTSIVLTNTLAEQVLLGNYNPGAYVPTPNVNHPDSISLALNLKVSADSLHSYLEELQTFQTRNSGSDTNSAVRGIGAARRWVYKKFAQFSQQNGLRLMPSYLQFNQSICGTLMHRNVVAVLPGSDTSDKSFIIVEAHLDTRCAGLCDTACVAQGMEDNGSGTALVIELARVMTPYSFKRTIVFMTVTAEEQGLLGAQAFAVYANQKNLKIRAVFNNDVIGGVICGKTASPPSCTGQGSIDSTNVRLFSFGGFGSPHKQLARFIKLEYQEMIRPLATVPMTLHIMTPEDRSGRGGDHIPFRDFGYTAMRFTSANENGDANVTNPNGYTDRQHTSADILGVDTDTDMQIDSFFVDFNYLARNSVINGNAMAMAASGPMTPDFFPTTKSADLLVKLNTYTQYGKYRLALRTTGNDWDTVLTLTGGPNFTITLPDNDYIISVAAVDEYGTESLFSTEKMVSIDAIGENGGRPKSFELLQNKPNPFDDATTISVLVSSHINYRNAYILILDEKGRNVKELPISLKPGMNEVEFSHGYHAAGTYLYTLVIDGRNVQSKKMVFTN